MDTKGGSVVFDRKDNDVYVGVSRVVESGTAGVWEAYASNEGPFCCL